MTKILIEYGTTEGQTARIAARLADVIRSHGLDVQTADLDNHQMLILIRTTG
jgi:menaquinone-dependent protoporphyrinogen oxidase